MFRLTIFNILYIIDITCRKGIEDMKTKEKKGKMRQKGISLIVLVITIIVIIILAAAVILTINNNNPMSNANRARYESDRVSVQEALTTVVGKIMGDKMAKVMIPEQEDIAAGIQYTLTGANDGSTSGTIGWENPVSGNVYCMGIKRPNYGIWKVNDQGLIAVEVDGVSIDPPQPEEPKDDDFGDNGNTEENVSKVMKPVLNGLTPVKMTEAKDGFVAVAENDPSWYQYAATGAMTTASNEPLTTFASDGAETNWANAQTADGSQFVWIPRYAYKIGTPVGSGKTLNAPIDVIFIDMNNKDTNGNAIPNDYIVHPAFTFGEKEIPGFWVAKFEASNNNGKVQIKPGQRSWADIKYADIFDVCYNMASENIYGFHDINVGDTHLMKNIEWGAVAYLAHSKYGNNGKEVSLNSSVYITGGGEGNAYIANKNQSTTGNISGVYDMNGGSYEYVAANFKNTLINAGSSAIFDSIFGKPGQEKFFDIYTGEEKKGDAYQETKQWFGDYYYDISTSYPFITRGGAFSGGPSSGIFAFNTSEGNSLNSYSFRPVVCGNIK